MRPFGSRGVSILLATAIEMMLVPDVPAFAQSDSVREWDAPSTEPIDPPLAVAGMLRPYAPSDASHPAAALLPPNLTASEVYRPLIERMLRSSPTFRKQCKRIGAARDFGVTIRALHDSLPHARARTRFTAGPGHRWSAAVELSGTADAVELIAHELEHVLEQIDGVDLGARATHRTSGVRHCVGGAFETTRAVRTGRTVAEEVRRGGS